MSCRGRSSTLFEQKTDKGFYERAVSFSDFSLNTSAASCVVNTSEQSL